MTYKPVGVDENSDFPPRVEARLSEKTGIPVYLSTEIPPEATPPYLVVNVSNPSSPTFTYEDGV